MNDVGARSGGFREALERHLERSFGKIPASATAAERFGALCLTVRDELAARRAETWRIERGNRRMYYLSLEYLMGRALDSALLAIGMRNEAEQALGELGLSLGELEQVEADAGLGSGGLGRLAACFLDSLATLDLPGHGYGLRYDYGLFRQMISDGHQVELPDDWLRLPHWMEIARPELALPVGFGGKVVHGVWTPAETVMAVPHDTLIPGYATRTVNVLRLFSARSLEAFDFKRFGSGDYFGAHTQRLRAESITRVLYPTDAFAKGQELRLKQQYFLVAGSLGDALARHLAEGGKVSELADRAVFQLNDTHPALAVPELMRLLVDVHGESWDDAWRTTQACLCYTNHTLLPEALERWPRKLLRRLLPRHAAIIADIDKRFLKTVKSPELKERVAIVDKGKTPMVRMAHLACIGCQKINGVAEIHSELLKTRVLRDFHELFPEKFDNKTNGITQRRWLLQANPALASLVTSAIGDSWLKDLTALSRLPKDAEFVERFVEARKQAKQRTLFGLDHEYGITIPESFALDVQVKRIHEYKRQLLNLLHVIHLYRHPDSIQNPRAFLIGGKAYPTYKAAKLIVKLANDVGRKINADPATRDKLRLHFVPDYRVSVAEYLIPGADISEQISTAGFEASGTGNMKFALNGALTLGTLDGANIEIAREVGRENCFIFGLTVDDVAALREKGYRPGELVKKDPHLAEVIELLESDFFNPEEPGLYRPLVDALMKEDYFLVLADFDAYRLAHQEVDRAWSDRERWNRMALANVSGVGFFSSDRTIREYARDIWKIAPLVGGSGPR